LRLRRTSTQVTPGSIAALVYAGGHQMGGELEVPVASPRPSARQNRNLSGDRLQSAQRLTQVILDVIGIFKTDRDADDTIRNA
jgi:hypothetical protein